MTFIHQFILFNTHRTLLLLVPVPAHKYGSHKGLSIRHSLRCFFRGRRVRKRTESNCETDLFHSRFDGRFFGKLLPVFGLKQIYILCAHSRAFFVHIKANALHLRAHFILYQLRRSNHVTFLQR